MQQLQQLKHWYYALPQKEQRLLAGTTIIVLLTLFYLVIWEPVQLGLEQERQKAKTQRETLAWMQQAAAEASALRASGNRGSVRDRNKAITLVLEQTLKNAGLRPTLDKIESSGSNGARVSLREASFNQILVWLNTLATHYAIKVSSAGIERTDKPGRVNVRLTFERS